MMLINDAINHCRFFSRSISVLEELDPVQYVLVLTIVLIGQPPPLSIIASKLGITLAYLSSCKLWFK
jgi:hypothetical protein